MYGTIRTPEGGRVDAILKFATYEKRVPPEAILNEWVATKCAEAVGLQVAPCWLVELDGPSRSYFESRFGLSVASDLGFATQFSTIGPIISPHTLARLPSKETMRLFLLDLLLANTDRIPENPNCGQANGRLFPYDFGSALPAPRASSSRFDRLFYPPSLTERAETHLCRGWLGRGALAVTMLISMIKTVSATGANRVETLPEGAQRALLGSYFDFLKNNERMVVRQIVGVI